VTLYGGPEKGAKLTVDERHTRKIGRRRNEAVREANRIRIALRSAIEHGAYTVEDLEGALELGRALVDALERALEAAQDVEQVKDAAKAAEEE
jgi:hypothetical protein